MDAFGDNFDNPPEVDPAAEFLAREQNQLAGLEDEVKPAAALITAPSGEDAFFSTADTKTESSGSFEMINNVGQQDNFEPTSALGSDDGNADDLGFNIKSEGSSSPLPTKPIVKEEPEKIKKWREEQKQRLEEKDLEEEKKKTELREQAKLELEEWYKHHEEQIKKTKSTNRNAEKQFVAETDDIEPGTEWERIAKLCDFNPKSTKTNKDVSRMRSIILQLKQTPLTAKKA